MVHLDKSIWGPYIVHLDKYIHGVLTGHTLINIHGVPTGYILINISVGPLYLGVSSGYTLKNLGVPNKELQNLKKLLFVFNCIGSK